MDYKILAGYPKIVRLFLANLTFLNDSDTINYDSDGRIIKQSDGLEFIYDASGIAGVKYGIRQFFYRKDAQGNIKEILDADGKAVIKYIYDAWGNHKTYCLDYIAGEGEFKSVDNYDRSDFNIESTKYYELAKLNPFRYRGYYYDTETKLYYLQTRYYDPEVGRFISQDSVEYADPEAINGLNLYAYCGNNPVMNIDPTGMWSWSTFWKILGVIVSIAIFVAAVVASAGAVGALAGVGAAALGLSTTTVSFISSAATIGTYFVASGIALFGISDAIEIGTGGYNPIRDDLMGGNQTAYDATKITFNVLGSLATLAGSFAPKVLQKIAKSGIPKISKGKVVGYSLDFFDANGNWSYRIDATDHGNSLWHHNPHYHILGRGGNGTSVDYFWYVIKRWFIK